MPTYNEPEKSDVIYHEPSAKGWFVTRWFRDAWFGSGKGEPIYTEPPKTNVTYTELQWIVSILARWVDIAGVTWVDLDEITWAGLDATYGTDSSHKVAAPDYTELEKGIIIITEPVKGD